MIRELKILAILIIVIGVIYWGVEPLAHSIMHPKVAPADYKFEDLEKISFSAGDIAKGEQIVRDNCIACHSIHSQNIPEPMDAATSASSYGVVPPDLSNVGAVFDHNFLANFLKDPVKAALLTHKFNDDNPYPMPGYEWLSDDELSNVVAFFASIAPKELTDKEVFEQACARCHSVKYDHLAAHTLDADLKGYLGASAPDLSMMIRSRGAHNLNVFINDPQKLLPGTSMPRVGLGEEAQKQVVNYLQNVGDSNKAQRDSLGLKIIIFFVVLALIAYAWKRKIWRDLH